MKKPYLIIIFLMINISLGYCKETISIAYNTRLEQIAFVVDNLKSELFYQGKKMEVSDINNSSGSADLVVLVQSDIRTQYEGKVQGVDFEGLNSEGYRFKRQEGTLFILAAEQSGAAYALLELKEHFQLNGELIGITDKVVNPAFEYRIVKFNLPWSPYRTSLATEVHTHTSRDIAFWEKFLDMMVENRLNVLSLWNNHPFPFMITSTNYPKATPFNQDEMAEWKTFWKTLFRMAKLRGIQTFVINWNIVVSPEFAEAYGVKEYNDLSDVVKNYTKESVTQLINEYEDLTGIGVTLADWMGNFGEEEMTPQKREDWIEETFVAGMKAAKRPVKFIHRSVLAGDPIAMRELIDRADLKEPALVEIKFNWSHGHSTPKLAITHDYHSGELDERFWNPLPKNYKIQWMVRNEDFFILRWGQPDFIRAHIKENSKEFVNGYFIGSEGYIPAMDYSHKPSSIKTWQYAFEKQWMFYKTWGRLLFQPDTPDSYFINQFELRYGKGMGLPLLEAYKLASNMPLRLASFYRSTWDYTLYSEGFIEAEPSSRTKWFDRSSPFISIDELINHETLDPDMISIVDYALKLKNNEKIESHQITPLALAETSEKESRKALELVVPLYAHTNEYSGALISELDDISTWSYLGIYFADKLRAGVALQQFRNTGDLEKKKLAIDLLEKCLGHWDQVIKFTKDRYNPTPHVSTQRYGENFQEFSWELLRPQVERDIQIAVDSKSNQ
ncbi:hypothetical protein [Cognataquiflexum rubidum]|uniref:hypothetical protein n=1 Tax=Cognataquiflexum rubidum TaxID=2922273 RepID=UPI001F13BF0B|nr:hypothetical protein [Cognataquiflexum rubidum]MCH6233155.1 hypothetical protein [Cognataquiflexum rubidum]